jgi:hypothetical protein
MEFNTAPGSGREIASLILGRPGPPGPATPIQAETRVDSSGITGTEFVIDDLDGSTV